MKIVFMGTPDFAVPALEALITGGHEIAAVVTQPDKPRGRGKAMAMPPVKEKALEHGIPVYQPERIRKDDAFFEILSGINPDVIVVIAFGQILPARILNLPTTAASISMPPCCLNIGELLRFSGRLSTGTGKRELRPC